jgi:hypothetical protein
METNKLMQESINIFLSREGQMRASSGFRTLAIGRSPTPRTPLYKDKSPDEVLANWERILDQESDGNPILQPLIEYDKSRKSKFGPQGGLRPFKDREEDFEAYYTTPKNTGHDQKLGLVQHIDWEDEGIFDQAEQIMFDTPDVVEGKRIEFTMNKRPLSPRTVIERDTWDDKLNTNSGCRDYARRSEPSVIDNAINAVTSGLWRTLPMILGSRSQRGAERFIFMAAYALNIVEKAFLYPLMDRIRRVGHPFFSAWEGFFQVELGFKETNFFSEDHTYIRQDFTKMDKHVNFKQMAIVYRLCTTFFQAKYSKEFEDLLIHILNIPVLISLDKLVTGTHGMPSGSGMTNFAESLITLYLILKYRAAGIDVVAFQGLGDDSVFAIRRNGMSDEEILAVMQSISSEIGQEINPEKQGIDEHTTIYLQRFFDDRIPNQGMVLGMYPSILALNTAIFPERFHDPRKWSKEMEILRWIMILENCKNLPYFRKLIQFFIEGDKYKLGLVLPDFFVTLPKLYKDSKSIKGFVPSYNQESLDRGIYDFDTVKILLEIASLR